MVGKKGQFALRSVSVNAKYTDHYEMVLDKKPVDVETVGNKLFVFSLDEHNTDDYFLSVFNLKTKEQMLEISLAINPNRFIKNNSEEIIVTYSTSHTTLNLATFTKTNTVYGEGAEPDLSN